MKIDLYFCGQCNRLIELQKEKEKFVRLLAPESYHDKWIFHKNKHHKMPLLDETNKTYNT